MEPYKIIQWFDENIMATFRGADVLFLTPCRDYVVLEGRASNNPSMGVSTGNFAFDASFLGVGLVFSAGLEVLRLHMQRRNERLQLKNKDYFLQKLIYLSRHFNNLADQHDLSTYSIIISPNDSNLLSLNRIVLIQGLEDALYYHGDHVIGLNQWYRRHFKAEKFGRLAESSLASLGHQKEKWINEAMTILDRQFGDVQNRRKEEYEKKLEQWREAEQREKNRQQNLPRREKIWNGLWTIGDTAWSSLLRYMMGYWVIWYAVWAITGLTAVSAVAAIGFSFGLPLIPVGIYLLYRVLRKNDDQPKAWEYFYHREIFIKTYFSGLNQVVKEQVCTLSKSLDIQFSSKVTSLAEEVLSRHFPKEMDASFLPSNIYRRSLMTAFASNLMAGLVLTEFGAWPIVAFLAVVGVAAAGGPFSVAVIAGVALAVGLFMAVRKTYLKHKEYAETEKLRVYHEYVMADEAGKKCDTHFKKFSTLVKSQEEFDRIKGIYDDLKQIAIYEKQNKILEDQLKMLYSQVNADLNGSQHEDAKNIRNAFKPIEALSNISRQERFYRRMSLETTPRTTLKKVLHAAFVGVSTTGTGILLIRLFFGLGCLIALHNPMIFLGLAAAVGLIWAGYKIYEHVKNRQDNREQNFIETRSLRLMASGEKNKFF